MWIAKPLNHLTHDEIKAWVEVERNLPLSQKLCWARAIQSVQGRAYLVFSPDEKVGGLVFSSGSEGARFECINGPYLNWDSPHDASRHVATFAHAVSRLTPRFQSLVMKPRWSPEQLERRLGHLPISPSQIDSVSTLVIPIQSDLNRQFEFLSPRLRRTLQIGRRNSIQTNCVPISPQLLETFVPELSRFAASRGFVTPPLDWFVQLTGETRIEARADRPRSTSCTPQSKGLPESSARTSLRPNGRGFPLLDESQNIDDNLSTLPSAPRFWLITSSYLKEGRALSLCQILVCIEHSSASYLFGYENRASDVPSAISTSAAAQWGALTLCIQKKTLRYDLNGYMPEAPESHPYFGVSQFKKQFNGELVHYRAPEFVIA